MYKIYYNNKYISIREYCTIKNINYNAIVKRKYNTGKEYYEILNCTIKDNKTVLYPIE